MAYTLQAIIGEAALLQANSPSTVIVIALPQGKAMIPLTDRLFDQDEFPFLPLTDGGESSLPESVFEFASSFVGRGKFVYVEAEFFGGDGTQASVTWDEKGIAALPIVDQHAINMALRFLGVQIGDHLDEFDALGLGRYRNTNDWEAKAKVHKN